MDNQDVYRLNLMMVTVIVLSLVVTDIIVMIVLMVRGETWFPYMVFLLVFVAMFAFWASIHNKGCKERELNEQLKIREELLKNDFLVGLLKEEGIDPYSGEVAVHDMVAIVDKKMSELSFRNELVDRKQRR